MSLLRARNRDSKNQGSVTLLTLLLASLIISISIAFNWYVREFIKNVESFKSKTEAMLMSYSSFEVLAYLLLISEINPREIKFQRIEGLKNIPESLLIDGTPANFLYPEIEVKVQDTNGLISLQPINEEGFKRLLKQMGAKNSEALLESYYDWVDTDQLRRNQGAEANDYKERGLKSLPRNYFLQYKKEFLLIKGFDKEIFKKISPFITLLPHSGFNPNSAPKEVLMAFFDIDEVTAQRIKQYIRNVKPIKQEAELIPLIGKPILKDEEISYVPSLFYEIKIKKKGLHGSSYEIEAGFGKYITSTYPYIVTHWIEE